MFAVGQKVEITGKPVTGTFKGWDDVLVPTSTNLYFLAEEGRDWHRSNPYGSDAPKLTGTITAIQDNDILVHLDVSMGGFTTMAWAMRPYKRRDGAINPNAYSFDLCRIADNHVYGICLEGNWFDSKRNKIEIIA